MSQQLGFIGNLTIISGTAVTATGTAGTLLLPGVDWLGFLMPAGWDAATLAVEFTNLANPSTADADWWTWATGAGDVALPAAVNRFVTTGNLGPLPFFAPSGATRMRVRSGTRAAAVNQTANRVIGVYGRMIG